MTFLGLDKKDWLHKASLVEDDKERIKYLSNALMADPDDGFVWHDLGDKYENCDESKANYCWTMSAKAYSKRLEKFKSDLIQHRKNPTHLLFMDIKSTDVRQEVSMVYHNLGTVYYNMKQYGMSADNYSKAFALDEHNHDAQYFGASALSFCKRYDAAEKLFKEHIEATNDYHSHFMLGRIKTEQNRIAESLHHFWDCIEAADSDADGYYYKYYSYAMLGSYKKAEYYLKKAFALEPKNPEWARYLIELYEETNTHAKAIKYYHILHKLHRESKKEKQK